MPTSSRRRACREKRSLQGLNQGPGYSGLTGHSQCGGLGCNRIFAGRAVFLVRPRMAITSRSWWSTFTVTRSALLKMRCLSCSQGSRARVETGFTADVLGSQHETGCLHAASRCRVPRRVRPIGRSIGRDDSFLWHLGDRTGPGVRTEFGIVQTGDAQTPAAVRRRLGGNPYRPLTPFGHKEFACAPCRPRASVALRGGEPDCKFVGRSAPQRESPPASIGELCHD